MDEEMKKVVDHSMSEALADKFLVHLKELSKCLEACTTLNQQHRKS